MSTSADLVIPAPQAEADHRLRRGVLSAVLKAGIVVLAASRALAATSFEALACSVDRSCAPLSACASCPSNCPSNYSWHCCDSYCAETCASSIECILLIQDHDCDGDGLNDCSCLSCPGCDC